MKRILAVLAIASLFIFSGCTKTCKCTATGNIGSQSATSEKTIELEEGKKCSDYNSSFSVGGVGASYECTPVLF